MSGPVQNLVMSLIPTLCLVHGFAATQVESLLNYRETFGDPGIYLDLEFPVPPHHLVAEQPVRNTAFKGYMATVDSEESIRGVRSETHGSIQYRFTTSHGVFIGDLKKGSKGCESVLHYRIERGSVVKTLGTLTAGFCS